MRFAALALLLAIGFAAPAQAGGLDLPCPSEVRAAPQLLGPATEGWIATPQSSRLVGLGIEDIGGQPALVCRYAVFGSVYTVWRRAPDGLPDCAVHPEGFRCRP